MRRHDHQRPGQSIPAGDDCTRPGPFTETVSLYRAGAKSAKTVESAEAAGPFPASGEPTEPLPGSGDAPVLGLVLVEPPPVQPSTAAAGEQRPPHASSPCRTRCGRPLASSTGGQEPAGRDDDAAPPRLPMESERVIPLGHLSGHAILLQPPLTLLALAALKHVGLASSGTS